MQQKSNVPVQDAGGAWLFNTRQMRAHHAHLAVRPGRVSATCRFCRTPMAAMVVPIKKVGTGDSVVEGAGDDKEGDPAPSRSDGSVAFWEGKMRAARARVEKGVAG